MRGCFIILHYKTKECTVKCVEALLKLEKINECKIIIYDNGSLDGSADYLEQLYGHKDNVEIIEMRPGGFSCGNNNAYRIAKGYNPHFVAAMNNDIIIRQKDFIVCVERIISDGKYHIIGPDIYAPRFKEHQSPLYLSIPSIDQLEKKEKNNIEILKSPSQFVIEERKKRVKINVRKRIPYVFFLMLRYIRVFILHVLEENQVFKYKNSQENVVLQGSMIVFTNKYINENDVLFEPETPFFYEELLLALKSKRLGYNVLYTPYLKAIHDHGVSTNYVYNDIEDYLKFNARKSQTSFGIYKKVYYSDMWKRCDEKKEV